MFSTLKKETMTSKLVNSAPYVVCTSQRWHYVPYVQYSRLPARVVLPTVQYYYGTQVPCYRRLRTTTAVHTYCIVYHTGQCCTALQYYSRYVVTSGVLVLLYYRCVGTGNTLQLVRLKLAPHDYLSSSELTNFDVIVSFFNVEKTVYFYTATLK